MSNSIWGSSVHIDQSPQETVIDICTYRLTNRNDKLEGPSISLSLNAARAVRYSLEAALESGEDAVIEVHADDES